MLTFIIAFLLILFVVLGFVAISRALHNPNYNNEDKESINDSELKQDNENIEHLTEKEKKGSLLATLLFLDNPLILFLFPSIRRSVRDYLNRD